MRVKKERKKQKQNTYNHQRVCTLVASAYLRPVRGCIRAGCEVAAAAAGCLGLLTFVLLFANSKRMVCGISGSNLTPCCKYIEPYISNMHQGGWYGIVMEVGERIFFVLEVFKEYLLAFFKLVCCYKGYTEFVVKKIRLLETNKRQEIKQKTGIYSIM